MKKKPFMNLLSTLALTSMFFGILIAPAMAAIPGSTLIFADGSAYNMSYANTHVTAIRSKIISNGTTLTFFKKYNGTIVNLSNQTVAASTIPAVTYTDASGVVSNYAVNDGDLVADSDTFSVVDIW